MSRKRFLIFGGLLLVAGFYIWSRYFHVVIRNEKPSGSNIIAFGDSLTYGTGAGAGQDYPAQLSKMIGHAVKNAGVPGETTGEALRRLDAHVLNQDPKIVIVFLGGNDILRQLPMANTFKNLSTIVEKIQDKGALVVLVGLKGLPLLDPGYGPGYRDLARTRGCVFIDNGLSGLLGNRQYMADQVHPNAAGYTKIAERVKDAIEPYL